MRKKYLKGIVAGMMVGAVVLTNGQMVSAKSDFYDDLKHNFGSSYDADKAQKYAIKYWGKVYEKAEDWTSEGYNNKQFHAFRNNDCTNFVSQCVATGGMVMVDDDRRYNDHVHNTDRVVSMDPYWCAGKSGGKWKATDTWTVTDDFEQYMREYRGITCHRTADLKFVRNNAAVGDVIQFIDGTGDVKHSVIVTKIYKGEVYITAHTHDYKYRALGTAYSSAKDQWGDGTVINLMKFTYKFK